MHEQTEQEALQEKNQAATASIIAAVILVTLKLIVGLSSNSLGLLSEAAHSGFDLLAALVTLCAIRMAARPADENHPYGHGKIENIAALIETLLLLATCIWIVHEAIERLFFKAEIVEPSIWGILVILLSIGIDYNRARMLRRVAEKHHSQALAADALHFLTDIWSSCVVLVGLIALYVARLFPTGHILQQWLEKTDAIAGILVALIIIKASFTMGKQAINTLLDSSEILKGEDIEEVLVHIHEIKHIKQLRVRQSGPTLFVDLTIQLPADLTFIEAHQVSVNAEKAIKHIAPTADITVHFEPVIH